MSVASPDEDREFRETVRFYRESKASASGLAPEGEADA